MQEKEKGSKKGNEKMEEKGRRWGVIYKCRKREYKECVPGKRKRRMRDGKKARKARRGRYGKL